MTKTQVEVITSVQRRRRWSRSEKERIVTAAMESGAVASEVARAHEPVVPLASAAL
jgi:transposase